MKKKSYILQHDTNDCGVACIAMISRYYGLKLPLIKIRKYAYTDLQGTNVLGLKEAGEKLGFQIRAVRGEKKDINKNLSLPAIAHVNKDGLLHYIVIYKVKKDKIVIADPAIGKVLMTYDDFFKIWTGILVFMKPTASFERGNEKKGIMERFWNLISPNKGLLTHIIVATIINTLLGLLGSFYFKYLIDDILANNLKNTLITFTIGYISLKIFIKILSSFRGYMAIHLGQRINNRLMMGYYRHVLKLPLSFFETLEIFLFLDNLVTSISENIFLDI